MAGDWIKMRGALLDHPKVIAVSRALQKHRPFRDWMTPGGGGPMNGQVISDQALRCVTTSLLMRVWSLSREHGKFVGDDLVLEHSEVSDIDQMAGAPGVGEAMQSVGWAIDKDGVTLPNFKEFNVPMTPAEKQKGYRERLKSGVTCALPERGNEKLQNVTTREEKRRSKPPVVPREYSAAFEAFWKAWPANERKQSRPKCWEAWQRQGGEQIADKIMAHVGALMHSDGWQRGFVPAPLVYLNQARWDGAEVAELPLERKVSMPC